MVTGDIAPMRMNGVRTTGCMAAEYSNCDSSIRSSQRSGLLQLISEMVAGVVSAPGLGMRWWGASAMGAFRNGTPIRASSVSALDDAQLSFAWDTEERFHAEGVGNRLLALSHQCWRTRGIGDFWQHLLVAEGAFDISIDPVVSLWDVAALVPIVDAAGARWSTLDGRHDVDGGSFLCTNGLLHDTVVKALA